MESLQKFRKTVPKTARRVSALKLLEAQLVKGLKPVKNEQGRTTKIRQEMSDSDKNRVQREIAILKSRI